MFAKGPTLRHVHDGHRKAGHEVGREVLLWGVGAEEVEERKPHEEGGEKSTNRTPAHRL